MKNVKKIRQLTMRLKMQWKILIGVLVAGVACGGVVRFEAPFLIEYSNKHPLSYEIPRQ